MKSSFLKFAVAASITFSAAAAVAQNGSDATNPQGSALSGGSFVPLPVPGTTTGGRAGAINAIGAAGAASILTTGANFTAGARVISPVTNQQISPAAVQAVGTLISGGSPSAVASISAALQAAGASPSAVASLTQALAALSNVSWASSSAAIARATTAFNAVIASAPASFFTANNGNPPAAFLAIHAALRPMIAAITR